MNSEYVCDWMTPDPLTTDLGLSVSGVYRLIKDRHIRRLPVVADDRLVGILTESDIFQLVAQRWSETEVVVKEPGGQP